MDQFYDFQHNSRHYSTLSAKCSQLLSIVNLISAGVYGLGYFLLTSPLVSIPQAPYTPYQVGSSLIGVLVSGMGLECVKSIPSFWLEFFNFETHSLNPQGIGF